VLVQVLMQVPVPVLVLVQAIRAVREFRETLVDCVV